MILRSMKIEQVNKILNQKLCSCQGCACNPRAPEKEEKDDGRGRSFRQRDEESPVRKFPLVTE